MKTKPNLAIFRSGRPSINKDPGYAPNTAQSVIPKWYREADRFAKNLFTKEYYKASKEVCPVPKEGTTDDYGKIPTWKACPAILDAFATGYVFKTPCDLTFLKNDQDIINVKIEDPRYKDFVQQRPPMLQFEHPKGYYTYHFAWVVDWGLELPEGYSALFMTPMNRFDIPFINTTGIVDCDKVHLLGSFPFFIVEGWEGTIPGGTPYMQVLPFKRENWEHKVEILEDSETYDKMIKNREFYRQPDGGVYKDKVWTRREYK
jgi:hypothetical protein